MGCSGLIDLLTAVLFVMHIVTPGELHFDGYNGKQRKEIENDKRLLAKKSASKTSLLPPVALIEPVDYGQQDAVPSVPLKRQRLDGPSDGSNIAVDEIEDGGDESVRAEMLSV